MQESWNELKLVEEFSIGDNIEQNITNCLCCEGQTYTDNLMAACGVKCKYSNENQLPKDSISQFDGSCIYDDDEFLTILLIQAHFISPEFQKTCQNMCTNNNTVIGKDSIKERIEKIHKQFDQRGNCFHNFKLMQMFLI